MNSNKLFSWSEILQWMAKVCVFHMITELSLRRWRKSKTLWPVWFTNLLMHSFQDTRVFSGSKNRVTWGINVCVRKETVDLFQCLIVGRVPVIIWLRKEAGHFEFSTVFINLMASLIEMYLIFIIIISKTMEL